MGNSEPVKVRLQKYMAACGIASRRRCEEIISEGRVSVNKKIVTQLVTTIDPQSDIVEVDGIEISETLSKIYVILNKPRGVLTTLDDPFGRQTILSFVNLGERVHPVGRLDFDTEGLLVLTNDGSLTFALTHPKSLVEKEYRVIVSGHLDKSKIEKLRTGVDIGGYVTAPAIIEELSRQDSNTTLKVVIREGKKRQIRKMFEVVGHTVIHLKRTRINNLILGDLQPGQWRYLESEEVENLKEF